MYLNLSARWLVLERLHFTNTKIKVKSVSLGISKTDPILLEETPTTALYFHPELHNDGIRGHFYRYKKTKDEDLEKITEKDFKSLKLHEGVHIELGIEQVDKLYAELKKRKAIQTQKSFEVGENEYVVMNEDEALQIIDENLKEVIKQILNQNYSQVSGIYSRTWIKI